VDVANLAIIIGINTMLLTMAVWVIRLFKELYFDNPNRKASHSDGILSKLWRTGRGDDTEEEDPSEMEEMPLPIETEDDDLYGHDGDIWEEEMPEPFTGPAELAVAEPTPGPWNEDNEVE
jgi:hypothetical protein